MAYTLVPTELIVDGAITSAKLDTNIAISGTLGVTGEVTLATHLIMGDNDKIKIGTGGDLEIYHDGSNSYISNSTGNIYLGDTNGAVHIQAKLNEESIICAADGAVTLYHDNSPKLATTSTGIDVTGTATMDRLTVQGTGQIFSSIGSTNGAGATLRLDGSSNGDFTGGDFSFIQNIGTKLQIVGGTPNAPIELQTHDGSGNKLRQNIASNGDISFYEDTGSTTKFFWDASAERLGIGTTSPSTILEIASGNSGGDAALDAPVFRINNTTESSDWDIGDVVGAIEYYSSDASGNAPYVTSFIKSVNETGNGTLPDGALTFGTSTYNASGGAVERMRIDSSGNVGIGDTSPSAKLDVSVSGSGTQTALILNNSHGYGSGVGTAAAALQFRRDSGGGGESTPTAQIHSSNEQETTSNPSNLVFSTKNSSGTLTEAMRIDSSGMLLVNTTSSWGGETTPHIESRGDVAGDYTGLIVSNTNDAASDSVSVNFGLARDGGLVFGNAGKISVGKEQDWTSTASTVDGFMSFSTMQNESLTERMRINSTGVVSIGNTENTGYSDDYLVQVGTDGSGSNSFGMLIRANQSGISKLGFADGADADGTGKVWYDHSSNYMRFDTAGSEKMRIDGSGVVLIGKSNNDVTGAGHKINDNGETFHTANTTSVQNTLHVFDQADSAYRFYVGQAGSGAGNIYATNTSITAISDERLKENIKDLETGLSEVMSLKPRRFDWKQGEGSDIKNVAGFIAQEVETVLPDLIGNYLHEELDDAKSVRMGDMLPTLVKAIQEQQTIIDDLKSRIETLEG